jgi:hypothetical protein
LPAADTLLFKSSIATQKEKKAVGFQKRLAKVGLEAKIHHRPITKVANPEHERPTIGNYATITKIEGALDYIRGVGKFEIIFLSLEDSVSDYGQGFLPQWQALTQFIRASEQLLDANDLRMIDRAKAGYMMTTGPVFNFEFRRRKGEQFEIGAYRCLAAIFSIWGIELEGTQFPLLSLRPVFQIRRRASEKFVDEGEFYWALSSPIRRDHLERCLKEFQDRK